MKTAAIIAVLILIIAAAVVGFRWGERRGQADFEPKRAMSAQDVDSIQRADRFLASAIALDEALIETPPATVRDFARNAANEHRKLRAQLAQAVQTAAPNVTLPAGPTPGAGDERVRTSREFLEEFIREHEDAMALQSALFAIEHPTLKSFATSWKSSMESHLAEARRTLEELPDTASNLGLLLLLGLAALSGAMILRRAGRRQALHS